ncbi:Outer membrane receptor proteins, mostly Fe transport [bacterium A37T11]|nr:Outer membrane receptor proteins, mostly Fe transport [bacterium A37T11]
MKRFIFIRWFCFSILACLLRVSAVQAQDTTLSLKVFGLCEQCQHRIENAAKGKGVKKASWDVKTKFLTLQLDLSHTSVIQVQERILKAGHDLADQKASDEAYESLPACCRYREDATGGAIQMDEVQVSSKQWPTYSPPLSAVRSQFISSKELLKAACCNLSESFETNPSVDVSYNDAVTGSKQIQLLGLSGIYTQLTVENMPGPRGLATSLGLNSIPGPWIESIQLTKGTGSVANGFESMAGQINVELKKPETSEALYANAYLNELGKTDLNLNLARKMDNYWSTGLLLHDDFLNNKKLDVNKDGFRDLPAGHLFTAMNRWKYDNAKGLLMQFGVKVLTDDKNGGQTDEAYLPDDPARGIYAMHIQTDRYEGFAKIGYVFPGSTYKSIGFQAAAFSHQQDAAWGDNRYEGNQKNVYANLIYQSMIGNPNHTFRTGVSILYDQYREDYQTDRFKRDEVVPGAFFEYTYKYADKFNAVLGIRADHDNLYGIYATPRLNASYMPFVGTTIRVSSGRGQRTSNIYAENLGVLMSARKVSVLADQHAKAYGLEPEVAWDNGLSLDQRFRLFSREAVFSMDFFRTDFTNQVVVDLEDPRLVKFYNLQGRSFSNSYQTEFNMEPLKGLDMRLAYRYVDVKTTYSGQLLQRPLVPAHRGFINAMYTLASWSLDYTVNYTSEKRLPATTSNPLQYRLEPRSPAFVTMNAQVSKSIGNNQAFEVYLGAENLTDFRQKETIVAADAPFGSYFDASMVWGPVTGRMFYVGLRFKVK